jgi:hypothetical protein
MTMNVAIWMITTTNNHNHWKKDKERELVRTFFLFYCCFTSTLTIKASQTPATFSPYGPAFQLAVWVDDQVPG